MDKLKPEAIRIQKGLSQDEFCKKIGISKSTYQSKISKKSRWYIDELITIKKIGNLDSVEMIELN